MPAIFTVRPLYKRGHVLFCSPKNKMVSEKTKRAKSIYEETPLSESIKGGLVKKLNELF